MSEAKVCSKKACGGIIKITHTFSGGKTGNSSSGICQKCKTRYTYAIVLLGEAVRGMGAKSVADKMRRDGNANDILR